MFDFVRNNTKLMMGLMFLLIIPSFVLFGLEGYSRNKSAGEVVAVVDGRDILKSEWDAAHHAEAERIRQSSPNVDAKLLDSPDIRYKVLERLVDERVLAAAVKADRLMISDARLTRELSQDQTIASMRKTDGSLDMERYKQVLGAQGMTPEMFEARFRVDLAQQQVLKGLRASTPALPAVADRALNAFREKREISIQYVLAGAYATSVKPTDAELQAFYASNVSRFQTREQADIEWLELDAESLRKSQPVDAQTVRSYFEQNQTRYVSAEQRRASHILLTLDKKASEQDKAGVKARAVDLLQQVRKAPGTFAELAKKFSQDPGSATQGGDLGFFGRGAMVKVFEDAAFNLNKGAISDVIESEFGWHIIQLTDVRPSVAKPFEEVKGEIELELQKQMAQKRFAEAAESFTNGVYEQADSLQPVAEKLKLVVQKAQNVGPSPLPGNAGLLSNAKFLNALFAKETIEAKRNTEAIEVAPGRLVSGRVVQYRAAKSKPFDEVKAEVLASFTQQRALALAREEGKRRLAGRLTGDVSAIASASDFKVAVLSRITPDTSIPAEVARAGFEMDVVALPAWTGVDVKDGYAVIRLNAVQADPAPKDAQSAAALNQVAQMWAKAEADAYLLVLKSRFHVTIKVKKPEAGSDFGISSPSPGAEGK
jgi:peptidyl-prolyl cis-trans isomerase D